MVAADCRLQNMPIYGNASNKTLMEGPYLIQRGQAAGATRPRQKLGVSLASVSPCCPLPARWWC